MNEINLFEFNGNLLRDIAKLNEDYELILQNALFIEHLEQIKEEYEDKRQAAGEIEDDERHMDVFKEQIAYKDERWI